MLVLVRAVAGRPLRLLVGVVFSWVTATLAVAQPVVDGFAPAVSDTPEVLAAQPDGKVLVGGRFDVLNGAITPRLTRLTPDGHEDFGFAGQTNGTVYAIAVQPDGKILVGGVFTLLNNQPRFGIGRLLPNGQLDTTFPDLGAAAVLTITVLADGKIVIGGTFSTVAGRPRPYLARLFPDGRLDESFDARPNSLVNDVAVQRDGRLIVAGGFTSISGVARGRLARLLPNGALDQSFSADASRDIFSVAVQDDGRILAGGTFTSIAGAPRAHLARLERDGRLDATFFAAVDDTVLRVAVQGDGRIVVGGAFSQVNGVARAGIARLLPSGTLDPAFLVGANDRVTSLAAQPDGAVVFGGRFTSVNGVSRQRLARATPDGRLDDTFRATANQEVLATAVQADGRLLVGGWFTSIGNAPGTAVRSRLARFLADGTLDPSFAPVVNGAVYAIAVQEDDRILIAGAFTSVNGLSRPRLARLLPDGTLDPSLPDIGTTGAIYALALQANGRLLVGGDFTAIGGLPRPRLARLDAQGSVDSSFVSGVEDGAVFSVALDASGRVLAGGTFTQVQGRARAGLVRVASAGQIDETFVPGVTGDVRAIAVQADGLLLVGGALARPGGGTLGFTRLLSDGRVDGSYFPVAGLVYTIAPLLNGRTTIGGSFLQATNSVRRGLARLQERGEADVIFRADTDPSGSVYGIVLDRQAKLAVGGQFTTVAGQPRVNLARLAAAQGSASDLRVRADGTRIDWDRGGGGPDIFHVRFDVSIDGRPWAPLGMAVARRGGWTLDGLSLPLDTPLRIRARGRYTGGYGNGSVSVVEVVQTAYLEADADRDGLPTAWELRFGTNAEGYDRDGDPDGDGVTNAQEWQAGSHPQGTFLRYLAEGATSDFFRTRLALFNPGDTSASVVLRFQKSDGTTVPHDLVLGPHTRATVDVETLPSLAASAFSTVLEADRTIVLDRTMRWDASGYGAHAETAVTAPATRWYLAEGATHSGFALFYLLQNPNVVPAEVRVTYLLPQGPPVVKQYLVGATSRFNLWVNQIPELASTDVSAVIEVTNGQPIVVERAMYLSRGGQVFGAGHATAAVPASSDRWFLAEGATGPYFDLFMLLANPDATSTAEVDVTYLRPDGSTRTKRYVVAPQSRFTIWVDEETFPGEGKVLAATAVSATVVSRNRVPIVVERAMWWPGTAETWHEAHASAGMLDTSQLWALADGEDGGPSNVETYILVANTSTYAGTARVTLAFEDGSTVTRDYPLGPTSRFNVRVRDAFPEAVGRRFGALVESVDQGADFVVERAMYADSAGVTWAAGTNAVATRLR